MKIKDYIAQSIRQYPSLYKDVDYEKSKLKVLDHIFFTNGNGLEMAHTFDPKRGGYIVDPTYIEKKGEWIRAYDEPYGMEKCKDLPDNYFTKKSECDYPFHPYPFSKNYCVACDVFYKGEFLQEDWMNELIFLCRKTFEFFSDEKQYQHDCYYPTEGRVNSDLFQFKSAKKEGPKGIRRLRKLWCYKPSDELPTKEEIMVRKKKAFDEYHKCQLTFLKKFLKKFDKTNGKKM